MPIARVAALLVTMALLWTFAGSAQAARGKPGGTPTLESAEASLELTRAERRKIQRSLAATGFDPGPADGLFGRATREAVRKWQTSRGQEATGYLDADAAKVLLAAGERRKATTASNPKPPTPPTSGDAEPGSEILRDKYILGLSKALKGNDYPKALEFIDRIEKLGGDLPPAVEYFRGEAYFHTGRYDEAQRALNRYVTKTGRKGRYYRKSLELMLIAEEKAEEAQRERKAKADWERTERERLAREAKAKEEAERRAREEAEREHAAREARERAEAEQKAREAAEREQALLRRPGRVFQDCPECPEMVVVPAGSFLMGSPPHEEGRHANEGPRHSVAIPKPFAVSKYEVMFAEWDACVAADGCGGHRPGDSGWGRGRRPVINVSWDDAKKYIKWMSGMTGKQYRLLSEAEWEYAARSGTTTLYSWGDDIGRNRANCAYDCDGRWGIEGQTVPVGSFPANGFGLHDMHGNVQEWVEDCWNPNYAGAPSDGRVWRSGVCSTRVIRDGSFSYYSSALRAAYRSRNVPNHRYKGIGFRVARTLAP